MPLYLLFLAVLLLSALIGVVNWKSLKSRLLHFFVPLLFLILAIEIYSYYVVTKWDASTGWIYNILLLVEAIFFTLFYSILPLTKRFRAVMLSLIVAFFLAEVIIYGGFESVKVFNTYLFLVGAFLIVLSGIFFLYQYFQLDNAVMEKKWLPVVWITAGLVIFYSVSSITIALYRPLVSYHITIFGYKLHQMIPRVLSIILYSCFARAFYLCKKII